MVRFLDFKLDLQTGDLTRDGQTVPLKPMATRALVLLVSQAGRLTTRDQLQDRLWGPAVVEWDQGVNQCIRQIRSALKDDARAPLFLETVPRRGYRFIAAVAPGSHSSNPSSPPASHSKGAFVPFIAGAAAGAAALPLLVMAICVFLGT